MYVVGPRARKQASNDFADADLAWQERTTTALLHFADIHHLSATLHLATPPGLLLRCVSAA